MLDTDIQELASLTTRDGDLENFERLFSKLKEMKGTELCHSVLLKGLEPNVAVGKFCDSLKVVPILILLPEVLYR